jgi:hypothetical protein
LRQRKVIFNFFLALIAKKIGLVITLVNPADVFAALIATQFGRMTEVIFDSHS